MESRDDGLPKPPREGFQIVFHEVKKSIEELQDVIAFIEKQRFFIQWYINSLL